MEESTRNFYKKLFICPSCQKKRKVSVFYDKYTREEVSVGKKIGEISSVVAKMFCPSCLEEARRQANK